MAAPQDATADEEARLALADALLSDDEPWAVCLPVTDHAGTVVDFRYVRANAAAEASVGLGPLAGRGMVDVVPEAREVVLPAMREVLATGARHRSVFPSIVRHGTEWLPGWTALDIRRAGGHVAVNWRSATAEHEAALVAERSEARLRALLENADEVIYVFSADGGTRLYQSPSMVRVLGPDQPEGGVFARVHPDDREVVERAQRELAAGGPGTVVDLEVRLRHSDGRWLWVHGRGANHVDDPDVGGIVVNLWDVTEHHELSEQLRRQALHDPLTGLPNRRFVDAELERALARARHAPGCVGLVLCDVDYFKSVNDALGHPAGDELLLQVGERLRTLVRPSDTVGRLGGDEFVVVCEDLRDPGELKDLTRRLHEALRGVYHVAGQDLPVTATVGASSATATTTATQLLSEADTALYEAKRAGRDGSQVFDQRVHHRNRARAMRQQALRSGVEQGQLVLHYQPKVHLRSGRVVAAEALVRWQHPTDGLLLPYDFLPMAEESLLVVDVGRWVLRQAMHDAAQWRVPSREPAGAAPTQAVRAPLAERRLHAETTLPVVNINLSGRHLTHPALMDHLDEALEHSGLHPTQVELEITETVLLQDLGKTARILGAVRDRGFGVALDDFGTGYSSLTWLQRLPVDTVKLDRSFVVDLLSPEGGYGPDILGSVTALAHALGKQVVAEGVEQEQQHDYLVGLGCDLAQGYLYGRPVPGSPFPPDGSDGRPTGRPGAGRAAPGDGR